MEGEEEALLENWKTKIGRGFSGLLHSAVRCGLARLMRLIRNQQFMGSNSIGGVVQDLRDSCCKFNFGSHSCDLHPNV